MKAAQQEMATCVGIAVSRQRDSRRDGTQKPAHKAGFFLSTQRNFQSHSHNGEWQGV